MQHMRSVMPIPSPTTKNVGTLASPFPTKALCENMPICGDLVATAMCYGTVMCLTILFVRTVTDASGRQAMDHSYNVIEWSSNLIVHGQLLPFEHRPGPDLHIWNGMFNPWVTPVRGEHWRAAWKIGE